MSPKYYSTAEMIQIMGAASYCLIDLHDELEELAVAYDRVPAELVHELLEKYDTTLEDLLNENDSLFI